MEFGEAVRAAILEFEPSEEEVMDAIALEQLIEYLKANGYKVEDVEGVEGIEPRLYFAYDVLKWTRQNA